MHNETDNEVVSIIVPIYNTDPDKLKRCFDSLLNQSYTPIQIVVVDASECDKTISFLDDFKKEHSDIVMVKSESGVSRQRNIGIKRSIGSFVGFIDSDDFVSKDYVLNLINLLKTGNCDIAAPKVVRRIYDGLFLTNEYSLKHNNSTIILDKDNYFHETMNYSVVHPVKIYKRSVIEQVEFPTDLSFGEDMLFNYYVCCKQSVRLCFTDSALYFYCSEKSDNAAIKRLSLTSISLLDKLFSLFKKEKNKNNKKGIYYQFNLAFNLFFDACLRTKNKYWLKWMHKYRIFQFWRCKGVKRKLLLLFPSLGW